MIRRFTFIAGMVLGLAPAFNAFSAPSSDAAGKSAGDDNLELAHMYREDQSDRQPPAGQAIDWKAVQVRDQQREARVKEMYAAGTLKTGKDYHRAAMILQHASTPEDALLAHELCVIAISKGDDARWLAAASEDRFLRRIGRPQRFGTQFGKIGDSPWTLDEIDPGVSDLQRKEMHVPPLSEARARVLELNAPGPSRPPDSASAPPAGKSVEGHAVGVP